MVRTNPRGANMKQGYSVAKVIRKTQANYSKPWLHEVALHSYLLSVCTANFFLCVYLIRLFFVVFFPKEIVHSIVKQGIHRPGRPGKVREFCPSGKIIKFLKKKCPITRKFLQNYFPYFRSAFLIIWFKLMFIFLFFKKFLFWFPSSSLFHEKVIVIRILWRVWVERFYQIV